MMRRPPKRAVSAALALGVSLAVAACNADQATGTGPALRPNLASDAAVAPVLKRTAALAHDLTASVTIADNGGGVLRLPEAGLQVVIPARALPTNAPVTITVTAVAGDAVAYEFEPHGLVFNRALSATQDLSSTTWSGNTGRMTLEAAYFASAGDLDVPAGTARISDIFPTDVVATRKRLHWDIPHFSGYVIVTGRGNAGGDDGDVQ